MTYLGVKTVPPRKRPLPAERKPQQPRPEFRVLEHMRYGQGKLVSVRQLDYGDYVAVVRFGDGTERSLQLCQRYWLSNIASLIPVPRPVSKPRLNSATSDDETESRPLDRDAEFDGRNAAVPGEEVETVGVE
jgi:hypothetical protein